MNDKKREKYIYFFIYVNLKTVIVDKKRFNESKLKV